MTRMSGDKLISIVAPIYNERDNIPELHRRIAETMAGLEYQWELLLVDDGSSDGRQRGPAQKAVVLEPRGRSRGADVADVHRPEVESVSVVRGQVQRIVRHTDRQSRIVAREQSVPTLCRKVDLVDCHRGRAFGAPHAEHAPPHVRGIRRWGARRGARHCHRCRCRGADADR